MNGDEAANLLAYAAAADPRLATNSTDDARARVLVWADLLDIVPFDYALERVRRFYRIGGDWAIRPGSIRNAWLTEAARRDSAARATALTGPRANPEPGPAARVALNAARAQIRESRTTMGWDA